MINTGRKSSLQILELFKKYNIQTVEHKNELYMKNLERSISFSAILVWRAKLAMFFDEFLLFIPV